MKRLFLFAMISMVMGLNAMMAQSEAPDYQAMTLAEIEQRAVSTSATKLDLLIYRNLVNMPMHSCRYLNDYQLAVRGLRGFTGKVVDKCSAKNGRNYTKTYTFDKHGLLAHYHNTASGKDIVYNYFFDPAHGFRLKSRVEDGVTYTYKTYYNDASQMIKLVCYKGDKITTTNVFTYSSTGRIIKRETFSGTSTQPSKVYSYSGGRPTMLDMQNGTRINFGNGNENRDFDEVDLLEDGKNFIMRTYKYTYNDNGLFTRVVVLDNQKEVITINRSYE